MSAGQHRQGALKTKEKLKQGEKFFNILMDLFHVEKIKEIKTHHSVSLNQGCYRKGRA
jgi:hypothetical protein